jgi:chromosome segregation ATPase
MGFVADFSKNNFKAKPGATQSSRSTSGARSYLADFGKAAAEPQESYQRNTQSQSPSPESQMRRAAMQSGKFSSFANFQSATSKEDAAKREQQKKVKNLRTQLKSVNQQLGTVVKAGNVAHMTEERLKDEIGRAKDKLASRSDQLKMKQKEKEDTDTKLERTKRMVSVLEARVHGPESRSNDWKWGLGASMMNDCLDLKLGFRLDEELNESDEYRLRSYLDEKRDQVWTLRDRASDKKDEVARIHAEVKVLEKGIEALQQQHTKTAATAEKLGRQKESLKNKKDRLQDQIYRLNGIFTV